MRCGGGKYVPSSLCVSVTVKVLDGCCVPGIKCDGKCFCSGSKDFLFDDSTPPASDSIFVGSTLSPSKPMCDT